MHPGLLNHFEVQPCNYGFYRDEINKHIAPRVIFKCYLRWKNFQQFSQTKTEQNSIQAFVYTLTHIQDNFQFLTAKLSKLLTTVKI